MPKPTDQSKYEYMFSDDMKFIQKVVVFHPEKKAVFLAIKRAMYHKYRPGDWDLPGGNVLYGEDAIESIQRETLEETCLTITNLKPIHVVTKPQFEGSIYLLVINYSATAKGTEVVLSHEHTDYKWVTAQEFSEMTQADFLKESIVRAFV